MRTAPSHTAFSLSFCAVFFLGILACTPVTGTGTRVTASVSVVSVTPSGTTAKGLGSAGVLFGTKTGFTHTPAPTTGNYIISGAPDYMKVTLRQIALNGSFSDGSGTAVAWSGSKTLTLDGITPIDTSDMTMTVPTGTVTDVVLTFDPTGAIKGSLTGTVFAGSNRTSPVSTTVYTSSNPVYAYSRLDFSGGAPDYTSFTTGPAAETAVTLNLAAGSPTQTIVVDTPLSLTLAKGDSPAFTILVDLSRMLRFYSGGNTTSTQGAINQDDPVNKAYFFSYTVFAHSIAAFFGTPGTIQGYGATYAEYSGATQDYSTQVSGAVYGWMTLVFATDGSILSGILSENDDNDLTVGKGWFGPFAATSGVFTDIVYSLPPASYNLLGFVPGTSVADFGYFNWNTTAMGGMHGEVEFNLAFAH